MNSASETRPAHYVDSHAHLYFEKFDDDRDEVIARARSAGFARIVNVSTNPTTGRATIELARRYPGLCYATVGIHPTETEMSTEELDRQLAEIEHDLVQERDVIVAIGEIGFDYYWDTAAPEKQAVAFRRQLELAARESLPVIIHCREAWSDTLDVVAEFAERVVGVFHCFGGTVDEARRAVDLGWFVSFAGNVSYPKAQDLRDAARVVPIDRLLLETDSPFLAPQAVRGQRNEPAFALHTAAVLADLLGEDVEALGRATTANAERLFGFG